MFSSLDFVYTPAADVDASIADFVGPLGGELRWKVRAMGTTVAAMRLSHDGPLVILAGHLHGEVPILVYRVEDYRAAAAELTAKGIALEELEIPHGPCATFRIGGAHLAVYELTRPDAVTWFDGRIDP